MRFTEQELRDFLIRQAEEFRTDAKQQETYGTADEVAYSMGAYEAYEFVLRFLDEYKLETLKPYKVYATLISNLETTVMASSQEEAEAIADRDLITDDFDKVNGEFTLEGVTAL